MSNDKRRLVVRLVRLQNVCERIESAHSEAYEFDYLFDGGEFSGPAIRRAVWQAQERAAQRLGFASMAVADDIYHAVVVWRAR